MSDQNTVDEAFAEVGAEIDATYQADADRAADGASDGDMSWLPDWFLEQSADLSIEEAAIDAEEAAHIALHKQQAEGKRVLVRAKWSSLYHRWYVPFQAQVNKDLQAQKGKKRAVDYTHGRAGYRKVASRATIVITDPAKAEAHARLVCPDAVAVSLKTSVLLAQFKDSGEEMPGTRVDKTEARDNFYPKRPEMESDDEQQDSD